MIPISEPNISGNEWQYVKQCLDTSWISSTGKFVDDFEDKLVELSGAKYAVACMNGTVGLQIAMKVAGVDQDCYVIAPNLTFIATLNAIKYTGAEPILLDVNEDEWQMDLDILQEFLQSKTEQLNGVTVLKTDKKQIKAIMPVHVLGNIGDMDKLLSIANQYNIDVIEDAAESLGTSYKGRHGGTLGKLGVISFNGNKVVTTGGGGIILTNDEALATHAKKLTTQAKISSEEYDHDEIGYNYRMVNVLAAIGVAQLELLDSILEKNAHRDAFYREQLADIDGVSFQKVGEHVKSNNWLTTLRIDNMRAIQAHLRSKKIQTRPLWKPMNHLPMFKDCLYVSEQDVTGQIYANAISLPSFSRISDEQLESVVKEFKAAAK